MFVVGTSLTFLWATIFGNVMGGIVRLPLYDALTNGFVMEANGGTAISGGMALLMIAILSFFVGLALSALTALFAGDRTIIIEE